MNTSDGHSAIGTRVVRGLVRWLDRQSQQSTILRAVFAPLERWLVTALARLRMPVRWRGLPAVAFAVLLAVLLFGSARQAWPAVNPSSLWLDDLWVATLVKHASLSELLHLHAPAPYGFVLILKLIRCFVGDGHRPLQCLGFSARLLTIAGVAWLAVELTRNFGLGLVAAAGMALQSEVAIQSVRIKQYALDACICVCLLGLALRFLRRPSSARLAGLGVVTLLALPTSFPSAFIGPVLLMLCALDFAFEQRHEQPIRALRMLTLALAFDVLASLLLFAIVRQKATPALQGFWSANYAPIESPHGFFEFFRDGAGWSFLTGAFGGWPWLGLLQVLGVAVLLMKRWTRPLGVFVLVLYPALVLSSVLRMYPIGEARVDCYLRPIVVLTCTLGLQPLAAWRRSAGFVTGALAIGATLLALAQLQKQPVEYPPAGDRPLALLANRLCAQPEVGLLLFPWANWPFAYYGQWPVRLIAVSDSTNGFFAIPQRPNTWVLRETWHGQFYSQYIRDSVELDEQLAPLMAAAPERLVFYGAASDHGDYLALLRQLEHRHYRVRSQHYEARAITAVLERH